MQAVKGEDMTIQHAINKLARREHLTQAEAEAAMNDIMGGVATPAQIGAYLMGLRLKGETIDEITGSARAMRAAANRAPVSDVSRLVDTCGTGGDGAGTFNISTTVAFVVAGAGLPVAKHGNRAVSSKSGSADVLSALGVNLTLTPEQVGACIDAVGLGFLFAPNFHPAMKHAIGPRRELAMRTIFNILGPLTNPAGASRQLLGVYDPALTEPLAHVLAQLGATAAFVVHGHGGLDELTTTGMNHVAELKNGEVHTYALDPRDFGFAQADMTDLAGGDAATNAEITRAILDGSLHGPKRDVVLLNAGAALMAGGVVADLAQGVQLGAQAIDKGGAAAKLSALVSFTNQVSAPIN
jgi:anthranilate phosphoribosyltransferase